MHIHNLVSVDPVNQQQDITRNGFRSLGLFSYIAAGLVVSAWAGMFACYWQWSVVTLLFLIPIIFLIRWWNRNRQFCDLNFIMSNYFRGFWIMSVVALFLQLLALFLVNFVFGFLIYLLFGTWAAFFPLSIIAYVLIEEYLKLWFAYRSRQSIASPNEVTKAHVLGATSNALGYATLQGFLWLLIICIVFDRTVNGNWIGKLFVAGVIVAVIGLPMHLLTGYLIGLELTRNVRSKNTIPLIPCGAKIGYLFLIWMVVAAPTTWAFVLCIVLLIVEYAVLIWYIKKIERSLPFDYLQRVGQLQIFGYLSLPGAEFDNVGPGDVEMDEPTEVRRDAELARQIDAEQREDAVVTAVVPVSSNAAQDDRAEIYVPTLQSDSSPDNSPVRNHDGPFEVR